MNQICTAAYLRLHAWVADVTLPRMDMSTFVDSRAPNSCTSAAECQRATEQQQSALLPSWVEIKGTVPDRKWGQDFRKCQGDQGWQGGDAEQWFGTSRAS